MLNPLIETCAIGAVFFGGHTLIATIGPGDIAPWATAIAGGICTIVGAIAWAYERLARKPARPRKRRPKLEPDMRPDRQAGGDRIT